jgi:hypothetical protein
VDRAGRLAAADAREAGALLAGAACLAGVAVIVAAAGAAGYAASSPLDPPGHWHAALAVAAPASFAAYAVGLLLLARRDVHAAPVFALAVAIQLTPLAGPLLLSRDPLIYDALGTIDHPFRARPDLGGGETYGPLWHLLSRPLARLDGGTRDTGAYAFRVLAAGCVLVLVWLAWRLAHRRMLAAALVGWNPFVALHYAGGGHNDAVMMVFVLGALLAYATGSPQLGGASWATAVALKWAAAWFLVLWAIERIRQRRPLGLLGLAGAAVALVVVATAVYGLEWPNALRNLGQQERLDHPSLGTLGWLEDAGLSRRPALAAATLAQLAALAYFAWTAWRGRLRLGLAAGALVLLAPRLDPWYALWPISLAAADEEDRWGRVLAVCLSGFLLSDAVTTFIEA